MPSGKLRDCLDVSLGFLESLYFVGPQPNNVAGHLTQSLAYPFPCQVELYTLLLHHFIDTLLFMGQIGRESRRGIR